MKMIALIGDVIKLHKGRIESTRCSFFFQDRRNQLC